VSGLTKVEQNRGSVPETGNFTYCQTKRQPLGRSVATLKLKGGRETRGGKRRERSGAATTRGGIPQAYPEGAKVILVTRRRAAGARRRGTGRCAKGDERRIESHSRGKKSKHSA